MIKRTKKTAQKHKELLLGTILGIILTMSLLLVWKNLSTLGNVLSVRTVDKTSHRTIQLGMWTQGFFDANTRTLHPEILTSLETEIDKKVTIAHYYRGWEGLGDPTLVSEFATIRSHGWIPMLNVNPYFFSECPPTSLPLYKAIAHGDCDAFLTKAAKNLRAVDKPFFLLFAWEMTNKDLAWSISYSGSTPQDFVLAWRHMHDIFTKEHVRNVTWVFCPNIKTSTSIDYKDLYPGDSYVDWVGVDGYNWGTTQSWSSWVDFAGVFTGSYNELVSVAPNKPVMIAEVNTTDQGGDKAVWYKDMLLTQLPKNFPHVQAVVIFNEDRIASENVNWKIDVTPESLEGFKEGIHSGYYQ